MRLVLAAVMVLSTVGVGVPRLLAGESAPSAEDAALLQEMAASIRTQQQELDQQLLLLAQATDPVRTQALLARVESLQHELAELTRLRDALQSPTSSPSSAAEAATQAAVNLEQRMDRQQRQDELKLDERKSPPQ